MPNHNKPVAGFNANPQNINKEGRPPEPWTWRGLIIEQMEKLGSDGKAVKEAVSASLVAKALEGDVVAIKEIGNRVDGMPKQVIEGGDEDKPIRLDINVMLDKVYGDKS